MSSPRGVPRDARVAGIPLRGPITTSSGIWVPACAGTTTTTTCGDSDEKGPNMKRSKPPFRADHVGSLLRPAALKAAREKRAKGEIGAADLKAIEDREIERVIKKQEEVGLQDVTDGEFRRSWAPRFSLGSRRSRTPCHGY